MARKSKNFVESDGSGPISVADLIQSELAQSQTYQAGELIQAMANNLNCYNGNPYGTSEGEQINNYTSQIPDLNRSIYQSNDVFNIVEQTHTMVMRPFMAKDEIVDVLPREPGDEQIAEQQRDMCNYNFFKENNGLQKLQDMSRNALIAKVGIGRPFWFESEEIERIPYKDLSDMDFLDLYNDGEMDIVKGSHKITEVEGLNEFGEPVIEKRHDVVFKRTKKIGQVSYTTVLPENFFVSSRQTSLDLNDIANKCTFVGERMFLAAEEIEALGIPMSEIDKISEGANIQDNPLSLARYPRTDDQPNIYGRTLIGNNLRKPLQIYRFLYRYDSDGDGETELHEIYYAEPNLVLKDEIIYDKIDYFPICSQPQPGNFYGLCPADEARPIQLTKTSLAREMVNNFVYNNIPIGAYDRTRLSTSAVNSFLNRAPGSVIEVTGDPRTAISTFPPGYSGDATLQLLSYFDTELEARTGINKMMMGLDADALNNNKGDLTANRVMSAAEERVQLIAKNFADGWARMFEYAIELMIRYEKKEKIIRVRNEYVKVDPRFWNNAKDVMVITGVGTGEKQNQIMALQNVIQNYQLLYQAGAFGVLFNQKNLFKALTDLARNYGIKYPDQYFQDPNSEEAQQFIENQKQNQQPPLEEKVFVMQSQLEEQKLALQQQKQEQDLMVQAQKQSFDEMIKQKDLEIKQKQTELQMLSEARMMHDTLEKTVTARTEQELKYKRDVEGSAV